MSTEKLNALQSGMDSKPAGQGTIALGVDASRTPQIPEELSILPVRGFVVFPGTVIPLNVQRAASLKLLDDTLPQTKVIGVQAEQAPSYVLSWRAGKPLPTETCNTCADGLATRTPEAANVAAIRKVVDEVALVSEAQMIDAIRHLYVRENVLAEPAGAAPQVQHQPGGAGVGQAAGHHVEHLVVARDEGADDPVVFPDVQMEVLRHRVCRRVVPVGHREYLAA